MAPLALFYDMLFHPLQQFKRIAQTEKPSTAIHVVYAGLFVLLVSVIKAMFLPGLGSITEVIISGIFYGFLGLVFWLITGVIYSAAAFTFGHHGRLSTLLVLTACAVLPWLFMPIASLFQWAGPPVLGGCLQALFVFAIWGWSVVLFYIALSVTWKLSIERLLLAGSLPILMGWVSFLWTGSFIYNLAHCFTS